MLSVDWEGEDFSSLQDVYALRQEIGEEIPVTHFICPAYFVKYPSAAHIVKEAICVEDDVALHLHPLRELVSSFDIPFRTAHNFYRPGSRLISPELWRNMRTRLRGIIPPGIKRIFTRPVSGRGVPLSVYTPRELAVLIRGSRALLEKHVGREIRGFRAGGNMASDQVLRVLEQLGFDYDASAFPPELLSRGYNADSDGSGVDVYGEQNGLYRDYMMRMWGRDLQLEDFLSNRLVHYAIRAGKDGYIHQGSQPFHVGGLVECPINGGMSDFAHARKTMLPLFERLLHEAEATGSDRVMSIGFHMEGAWKYKSPVAEFISLLKQQYVGRYEFTTYEQAGLRKQAM